MPLNFHCAEPSFDPVEKFYRATDLTEEDRRTIFNRHRGIFEA
jgi:hypothetical protein